MTTKNTQVVSVEKDFKFTYNILLKYGETSKEISLLLSLEDIKDKDFDDIIDDSIPCECFLHEGNPSCECEPYDDYKIVSIVMENYQPIPEAKSIEELKDCMMYRIRQEEKKYHNQPSIDCGVDWVEITARKLLSHFEDYTDNLQQEIKEKDKELAELKEEQKTDFAIQQFTGWRERESTCNIESLCESMGLQMSEWNTIRADVETLFDEDIIMEIDTYCSKLK